MRPYLHVVYKCLIVLFLSISISQGSSAQHLILGGQKFRVEAGLNFGPTFFLGDLGGNRGKGTHFLKDLNMEFTTLMKGAFVTFYPNKWIGFRVAGQYTFLHSEDDVVNAQGGDETYRKERNLDFKSNVWEAYGAIEFYPTMIGQNFSEFGDEYEPRLKPYLFAGVGAFHFNPKGSLTDVNGTKTWYELHPLRTEGQGMAEYPNRKPYSLTQLNVPFGAGLKYDLTPRVNIGTEVIYRKTFTDYIDDVSTTYIDPVYFAAYLTPQQAAIARAIHDKTGANVPANRTPPGEQRGNSKNMDSYFSTVIKLGIKIGNDGLNNRELRQTRCPSLY
ncbi:MAG: hypothetical protein QM687_05975 [Ferruginibacter sp.]